MSTEFGQIDPNNNILLFPFNIKTLCNYSKAIL